jgi:glycosyltransferase involved in cell wall biosynthesis
MNGSMVLAREASAALPETRAQGAGKTEIVLDVSRLLSRVLRDAPTGIDRVEMAYALRLARARDRKVSFGAVHPAGFYGRLPRQATLDFISETAERWAVGAAPRRKLASMAEALVQLGRMPPLPAARKGVRPRAILQVSPHHLHRAEIVGRKLRAERARFVCMVHDLIPIEFPEYARPGGAALHQKRMETIGRFADGVVAVSETTRRAVLPYLEARRPSVSVISAGLGVDGVEATPGGPGPDGDGPGYMVMLGTIEPRKNHALVLNVLRQLAQERGPHAAPRLHLVGARGWESENVRDLLERSATLKPVVMEANGLPDNAVRPLLRGARALLMPSFAEGYGLPIAEALSLGTPVICSDIPAHREVGQDAPDYLDPTDGPAWRAAILDYADPDSARRKAQLSRIERWRPPSWDAHLSAVLDFVDSVCR